MTGYLVDTSIFVASEQRRPLSRPPAGDARVSVATLTELEVGVLRSTDAPLRRLRSITLARARRFVPLSYDDLVAERLAVLLAAARTRHQRAGGMDAIIAATALVHGLVVWTQDDDFAVLAELSADLRVHRG